MDIEGQVLKNKEESASLRYKYRSSRRKVKTKRYSRALSWMLSISFDRFLLFLLFGLSLTCLVFLINQDICWTYKDEMNLFTSIYRERSVDNAIPLEKAHSHNDYEHENPLFLALSSGFCSVEADVHADSHGRLHLGHFVPTQSTLTDTYLEPLKDLALKREGRPLYRLASTLGVCEQVTLLIDMKTDPIETWEVLSNEIARVNADAGYRIFECYEGNANKPQASGFTFRGYSKSPVRVVVSGVEKDQLGSFAAHVLRSNHGSFCTTLDGRFDPDTLDLTWNGDIAKITSWISGPWTQHVASGMHRLVTKIHEKGLKLRFWDVPDDIQIWNEILDFGVDIISTDHIVTLASFLSFSVN